MMGGSLELESVYGKGSTFSFDLRLPCERELLHDSNESQPKHAEIPLDYSDKKILIVEDNPVNMQYAQTAISIFSDGIQVIKANNGQEAYQLYREYQPDLILMDIRMPKMNGYQATAMIRADNDKVPIVAMTAKALEEDKEKCLAAGMDEYLTKPVSFQRLKETFKKYL